MHHTAKLRKFLPMYIELCKYLLIEQMNILPLPGLVETALVIPMGPLLDLHLWANIQFYITDPSPIKKEWITLGPALTMSNAFQKETSYN